MNSLTNDLSTIGVIILAAGASTRLGTPKQLLPYQGQSLLHYTTEVAIASGCQPIVVVLGAQVERLEAEVAQLPVTDRSSASAHSSNSFFHSEGM